MMMICTNTTQVLINDLQRWEEAIKQLMIQKEFKLDFCLKNTNTEKDFF